MTVRVTLSDAPFDPYALLAQFARDAGGDIGAIASFVGQTRATSADGAAISAMELTSYRSLTLRSMEDIAAAAATRFGLTHLLLLHRVGRMVPGEPVVLVAAAASHRRNALQAVDYAMDRLKSEAVFWKAEMGDFGRRWIEPSDGDAADLARWTIGQKEHDNNGRN